MSTQWCWIDGGTQPYTDLNSGEKRTAHEIFPLALEPPKWQGTDLETGAELRLLRGFDGFVGVSK